MNIIRLKLRRGLRQGGHFFSRIWIDCSTFTILAHLLLDLKGPMRHGHPTINRVQNLQETTFERWTTPGRLGSFEPRAWPLMTPS